MAATEGYSVPGQNGDASTSTVGGGAGQSGLGRSSEPTFSAALTVWKGESVPVASYPVQSADHYDMTAWSLLCFRYRHQPGRPAKDTRRAGTRDHRQPEGEHDGKEEARRTDTR